MSAIALMNPSKETDNKLRWSAVLEGVQFKLYVPKWRVPTPWPVKLEVTVHQFAGKPALPASSSHRSTSELERPIAATLEYVDEHSETVRYRPVGDSRDWELGEPYIPYTVLPSPPPRHLRIEVRWDRSAGIWSE